MVLVKKAIATLHKLRMSKKKEGEQKYCPIAFFTNTTIVTLVDYDGPNGISVGEWRRDTADASNFIEMERSGSNNYSKDTGLVREAFKDYFNYKGTIDWQWEIVNQIENYQYTYFDQH